MWQLTQWMEVAQQNMSNLLTGESDTQKTDEASAQASEVVRPILKRVVPDALISF